MIMAYPGRLCDDEGSRRTGLLPFALIRDAQVESQAQQAGEGKAGTDPGIALIDDVVAQFQASMPKYAGRLKLPRYLTIRAALDVEGSPAGLEVRRRAMLKALYADLQLRRPWVGGFGRLASAQAGGLAGLIQPVVSPLVEGLPRWVYGAWLRRTRRLRWVKTELRQAGNPAGDFLTAACGLVPGGQVRQNPVLVRQLLLHALLRDLDRAVRPSRLWVYRPRRQWPFVLLLADVGEPGTPSRQFLDDYSIAVQTHGQSQIMLVGALHGTPPTQAVSLGGEESTTQEVPGRVAELLNQPPQDREFGGYLVPLAAEADDGPAAAWLQLHRKVPITLPRRADYVRPVAVFVIPAMIAGGIAFMKCTEEPPPCYRPAGSKETLGITDGIECSLANKANPNDPLTQLQQLLADQNNALDGDSPHRTVVFFAPLTVTDGRVTPNSIQQLRGVILAQQERNRPGVARVPIRILLANPGDRFHGGEAVADQIVARKKKDPTISAVIGIAQSRTTAKAAIVRLANAQIPVIGGSVTGDQMSDRDSSPYYFQISPRNERIAKVAARFAMEPEISPLPRWGAAGYRPAIVVYDPQDDDLFSSNLKQDFTAEYPSAEGFEFHEGEPKPQEKVQALCQKLSESHGFIFHAGRPQGLRELLEAMQSNRTCLNVAQSSDGLTVLAGSAATTFMADKATKFSRYKFVKFYYMSFYGSGETLATADPRNKFDTSFRQQPEFAGFEPDSDSGAAYDALTVASRAIDEADGTQDKTDTAYTSLVNGKVVRLAGVTGTINLAAGHRFVPNKAVYILVVNPETGASSTIGSCGRFPLDSGSLGSQPPCQDKEAE